MIKLNDMLFFRLYTIILICCFSFTAMSQTITAQQAKKHPFSIYAGFGPNIYFNNLVVAKNHVNVFNYSFVGRFMWEPEHFLSLGLETGYYRLYSANFPQGTGGPTRIVKTAVPVSLVTSIRFLRGGYANVSIGQTCLTSRTEGAATGETATSG